MLPSLRTTSMRKHHKSHDPEHVIIKVVTLHVYLSVGSSCHVLGRSYKTKGRNYLACVQFPGITRCKFNRRKERKTNKPSSRQLMKISKEEPASRLRHGTSKKGVFRDCILCSRKHTDPGRSSHNFSMCTQCGIAHSK